MYRFQERTHRLPPTGRRLLRQGARLPWDPSLREGPTQTQGVGRAAVRRGQGLARDEEVPSEKAREGEHRSFADRLGPKRQATARLRRPQTEEAGSGGGAPAERHRPSDQSSSGASFEPLLAANEGIFQHAKSFSEQQSA